MDHGYLDGGNSNIFFSSKNLGKWSNLTVAYFSNGLVQTTNYTLQETNIFDMGNREIIFKYAKHQGDMLIPWRVIDLKTSTCPTFPTCSCNLPPHSFRGVDPPPWVLPASEGCLWNGFQHDWSWRSRIPVKKGAAKEGHGGWTFYGQPWRRGLQDL